MKLQPTSTHKGHKLFLWSCFYFYFKTRTAGQALPFHCCSVNMKKKPYFQALITTTRKGGQTSCALFAQYQKPWYKTCNICVFGCCFREQTSPSTSKKPTTKLMWAVRAGEWPRTGCRAPAALAISGFVTGWVSTIRSLTEAGPKSFASTNHLHYIPRGACCAFTEDLHKGWSHPCPVILWALWAWTEQPAQKSWDLLALQVNHTSTPSPWVLSRGGNTRVVVGRRWSAGGWEHNVIVSYFQHP